MSVTLLRNRCGAAWILVSIIWLVLTGWLGSPHTIPSRAGVISMLQWTHRDLFDDMASVKAEIHKYECHSISNSLLQPCVAQLQQYRNLVIQSEQLIDATTDELVSALPKSISIWMLAWLSPICIVLFFSWVIRRLKFTRYGRISNLYRRESSERTINE